MNGQGGFGRGHDRHFYRKCMQAENTVATKWREKKHRNYQTAFWYEG